MDPVLSRENAKELEHILEDASRSYAKEVQLNDKASFNILRVLSSFRLLYPEAPQSLYNAIIYLTNIFNPQSLIEWKRAIADWKKMDSARNIPLSTQKQRINHRKAETSKYMKTYQNSFNRDRVRDSHFQSKSFAQIKVPAHDYSVSCDISADRSRKEITETNAETGKRQFYTKADSVEN